EPGQAGAVRKRDADDRAYARPVSDPLLPVRLDVRHLRRRGDLPVPVGAGIRQAATGRGDRDGGVHHPAAGGSGLRGAKATLGMAIAKPTQNGNGSIAPPALRFAAPRPADEVIEQRIKVPEELRGQVMVVPFEALFNWGRRNSMWPVTFGL